MRIWTKIIISGYCLLFSSMSVLARKPNRLKGIENVRPVVTYDMAAISDTLFFNQLELYLDSLIKNNPELQTEKSYCIIVFSTPGFYEEADFRQTPLYVFVENNPHNILTSIWVEASKYNFSITKTCDSYLVKKTGKKKRIKFAKVKNIFTYIATRKTIPFFYDFFTKKLSPMSRKYAERLSYEDNHYIFADSICHDSIIR